MTAMNRRPKTILWVALTIYDVVIVAILGLMIWANQQSMEGFPFVSHLPELPHQSPPPLE
jgi:hypothetical protein